MEELAVEKQRIFLALAATTSRTRPDTHGDLFHAEQSAHTFRCSPQPSGAAVGSNAMNWKLYGEAG